MNDPISTLLEKYNNVLKNSQEENKNHSEIALYYLLKAFKDKLPEIGDNFHKEFRSCGVVDDAETDAAIYSLLNDAPIFWKIFDEEYQKQKIKKIGELAYNGLQPNRDCDKTFYLLEILKISNPEEANHFVNSSL